MRRHWELLTYQQQIELLLNGLKKDKKDMELKSKLARQKFKFYKLKLNAMMKNCINAGASISFYNFSDSCSKEYVYYTQNFGPIANDLSKISDLSQSEILSKKVYPFIFLHFYSSNYDSIINYVTPLAKEINKVKNYYKLVTKAGQVLDIFEKTDKRFYSFLRKFLFKDLRNAVSHNTWELKGEWVFYKTDYAKGRINMHKVHEGLVNCGSFMNGIMCLQLEYELRFVKLFKKQYKIYSKKNYKAFRKETNLSNLLI
jgi:hypothetical protein